MTLCPKINAHSTSKAQGKLQHTVVYHTHCQSLVQFRAGFPRALSCNVSRHPDNPLARTTNFAPKSTFASGKFQSAQTTQFRQNFQEHIEEKHTSQANNCHHNISTNTVSEFNKTSNNPSDSQRAIPCALRCTVCAVT